MQNLHSNHECMHGHKTFQRYIHCLYELMLSSTIGPIGTKVPGEGIAEVGMQSLDLQAKQQFAKSFAALDSFSPTGKNASNTVRPNHPRVMEEKHPNFRLYGEL